MENRYFNEVFLGFITESFFGIKSSFISLKNRGSPSAKTGCITLVGSCL